VNACESPLQLRPNNHNGPATTMDLTSSETHQGSRQVGEFYDRLDKIYRHGALPHVHHGLWLRGNETREEAKENLVIWVAQRLALKPGERYVDIGSGYGEMARQISKIKNVQVTAITNSASQHHRALQENRGESVEYHLGDWCSNDLPSATYDAAWAVESIEHITDLNQALLQCRRVLKPCGRLIILSWLAGTRSKLINTTLLKPLANDSLLAPLRTQAEIVSSLSCTGFSQISVYDLTGKVRRTWTPTLKGVWSRLGGHPQGTLEPGLAWRTMRIALAYSIRSLNYCAISATAQQ
jgi:tocopherol O-methyltransferase